MDKLNIRIVHMEAMRVASAVGFGGNPEEQAWNKILAFAKAKGLPEKPGETRFFGFNNPDPSPGNPNYGYEQWMTVGSEVQDEGDIQIKVIPAGSYAVARFTGMNNITETWKRLVAWLESSPYRFGSGQGLEELLTPINTPLEEWVFDLYLPISE